MPGLIVSEPLVRLTDPRRGRPLADGAGSPPSGSGAAWAPVTGAGLMMALPMAWTPPTTWMLPANTRLLSEAERAEGELESTSSRPVIWMRALFEMLRAPAAVGFRT